ncbi:hypothetical protein [Kitasatospora sp. NPDC088783]|uniref:hypothetical protein n=1 Tax=Kitasatospora sp. NPDC088783 TaxID=3364077 RepID=UPI0037F22BDB
MYFPDSAHAQAASEETCANDASPATDFLTVQVMPLWKVPTAALGSPRPVRFPFPRRTV